jgi:hypothetical protein
MWTQDDRENDILTGGTKRRGNLHLRGFLLVVRIRPGLLVRVVIGTPRQWLLGCYRGLTLWTCARLTFVAGFGI